MSKTYGKTTTFSTKKINFMTTAQKSVVFIVTKQGNFHIFVHAV